MSKLYDEWFPTPGERLIGFVLVMLVACVVGIIPYMAWLGGLIIVHYIWWWMIGVMVREDDEEWHYGK